MANSSKKTMDFRLKLNTQSERKKRVPQEKKESMQSIRFLDKILNTPVRNQPTNITSEQLKILFWKFGKSYFKRLNREFVVDENNRQFLDLICKYFSNDPKFEEMTNGELRKGLFIYGCCGTGKSSVFDIVREISRYYHLNQLWFTNVSVHTVVSEFNKEGEIIVDKYSRGTVHFDDLGTENLVQLWGIKENLLERLLQIRYNNFKAKGTKTYVTTNLLISDMKKIYGKQVYDRIFEMFNFIELEGKGRRW